MLEEPCGKSKYIGPYQGRGQVDEAAEDGQHRVIEEI